MLAFHPSHFCFVSLIHLALVLLKLCRPLLADNGFLRKEVIQPLLPQRLPCYDFTPITTHTLVRCLPEGLAYALLVQATLMV